MTAHHKQTDIITGDQPLEEFKTWLANQSYKDLFVLTDTAVAEEAFPVLEPYIEELNLKGVLTIPPGESQKTTECCEDVWRQLIRNDASRKSLVLNLGGGVVTDLGGFVAGTFKRGIAFIHIPTTLLGMVDAALGGKHGVNLDHYKNQVGIYQNPEKVVIAPEFLQTLEDRQVLSGFSEMIKHALVKDNGLWEEFQQINPLELEQLSPFIVPAANIKLNIVANDPFEDGERKKLNFGHTIGHALESLSQERDEDPLLHGEAIAIGMRVEAFLSKEHLLMPDHYLEAIDQYLKRLYPSYQLFSGDEEAVISYMKADKKRDSEAFNFTLLVEAGHADTDVQLDQEDVKAALAAVLAT